MGGEGSVCKATATQALSQSPLACPMWLLWQLFAAQHDVSSQAGSTQELVEQLPERDVQGTADCW